MNTIDYRITHGTEFLWSCWNNARYYDCENQYGDVSMIADPVSKTVYQITAYKKSDESKPYRWLNPLFADAQLAESKQRRIDQSIAWKDTHWIDTESETDILDKARAILNNVSFDETIVINIWLDHATIAKIAISAHEANQTLNDYIVSILKKECSRSLSGSEVDD